MNTATPIWLGIGLFGLLFSPSSPVIGSAVARQAAPATRVSSSEVQKLTPYLRAEIAERSVDAGESKWTVLIAGAPGKNAAITQQILAGGGSVQYRLDSLDYLRARVPMKQVERLADLAEVEAIDILNLRPASELPYSHPCTWPVPVPTTGPTASRKARRAAASAIAPPTARMPAVNPYLPSGNMGAPQFVAAHPTFDGRGVTVAVVEGAPAMLSPELLQPAMTLDGRPTRKLIGLYSGGGSEAEDPYRVHWEGRVIASEGRFTVRQKTYTAPADGEFRLGFYDIGWVRDIMTQGTVGLAGSASQVAVLWNEKTNTFWVDADQNQSFRDEKLLHDYNATAEVGVFRTTAAQGEGVPFALCIDGQTRSVDLYIGMDEHTTGVSSVAVGRGFLHSAANGVAPGAQIAVVLAGTRVYGILESLIRAMTLSNTDVVFCAAQWGGEASGQEAFNRIVQRLIALCRKPLFASAGNDGPGLTTLTQLAAAPGVIAVGGYIDRATSRANLGAVVRERDYVNNVSSCGPGPDGDFKPDLLAPLSSLAAAQPYDPGNRYFHEHAGMYTLPPGYHVWSGTSYSSPMAAGAAALLISAAWQCGLPCDAERLRWALKSSARRIKGYQTYEQGSGLIDVPAAWEALQRALDPVAIAVRAPVHRAFSRDLPVPDEGVGLYEREGWRAGMSAVRTVHLKRTSGAPGSVPYRLTWVGNDRTFRCASTVQLPLGQEVTLPITVHPPTPGIHSASLQFRALDAGRTLFEMSATIVVAEPLTPEAGASVRLHGRAEWQRRSVHYFYVPEKTGALEFDVALTQGEKVAFTLHGPDGQAHAAEVTSSPNALHLHAPDPEPGVWEVLIENGTTQGTIDIRNTPPLPARYTLRAAVIPRP